MPAKRLRRTVEWSVPVLLAQTLNSALTAGAAALGQLADVGAVSIRAIAVTFGIMFSVEMRRFLTEFLKQRGQ